MEENKSISEAMKDAYEGMTGIDTKQYILSKPKAPDLFTMTSIIGKIGVNKFSDFLKKDEIKSLVNNSKGKKEDIQNAVGIEVFIGLAQILCEGMPKCEDDIYKLLSSTSNLSLEEVKNLDGVTFLEMITDFFKSNKDFIKAASKLIK